MFFLMDLQYVHDDHDMGEVIVWRSSMRRMKYVLYFKADFRKKLYDTQRS